MTVHEQLAEQVQRVAQARLTHAILVEVLKAERVAFDARFAQEIEAVRVSAVAVTEAEASAKALGLAHFQMTGEKKPTPGIEVKEKSTLDYDDADALAWAKETNMALVPETFDRKAFEKIAKATDLGFVNTIVEPQVQLASDLTPFLPE